MEDHEKLELLLFYALPRVDTNELAHRLLDRFETLVNIFDAPLDELTSVDGMGEVAAVLLKMVPHLAREYIGGKSTALRTYNEEVMGDYLRRKFIGRTNEFLLIMALDSKSRVLYSEMLAEGSIDAVPVRIKRIVEIASRYNVEAIVLAHNHPSGSLFPSKADVELTQDVDRALRLIGAYLLDHYIVNETEHVSLHQLGVV